MEYRKVLDILAYYLSEYDTEAFKELGFRTQTEGFESLASLYGKKGSYLRRLRDEYDVVTNSFRRGQCNRPPRKRIICTTKYLKQFTYSEITELVNTLIENAGTQSVESEEISTDNVETYKTEFELESILNFTDEKASLKIRTGTKKVRVYNTAIIGQLKKLYRGKCQICGSAVFKDFDGVDVCEVHHIDYFCSSQNNDATNLIVLCPNHHRLIHKLDPKYDRDKNSFLFPGNKELHIELDYHLSTNRTV